MECTNLYFDDTLYPACYRSNTHPTTVSVRGMRYIPVFGMNIGLGCQISFHFLQAKGENACFFGCFFQNTRPKNRKTYFSLSFSESTLQCGHFAPLFTRIGSRSSEIENKTFFSTSPCMGFHFFLLSKKGKLNIDKNHAWRSWKICFVLYLRAP